MNVRRRRRTIVNTAPARTGLLVTTRVTATTATRDDSVIQVGCIKIQISPYLFRIAQKFFYTCTYQRHGYLYIFVRYLCYHQHVAAVGVAVASDNSISNALNNIAAADDSSSSSSDDDVTKLPMIYGAVAFGGVALSAIAGGVYQAKKRKSRGAAAAAGGGSMYSMQSMGSMQNMGSMQSMGSMQNMGSDYNVAYY